MFHIVSDLSLKCNLFRYNCYRIIQKKIKFMSTFNWLPMRTYIAKKIPSLIKTCTTSWFQILWKEWLNTTRMTLMWIKKKRGCISNTKWKFSVTLIFRFPLHIIFLYELPFLFNLLRNKYFRINTLKNLLHFSHQNNKSQQ